MRGREDATHHQTLFQTLFVALLTHAAPLMTDGSQINRASVSSSVTTAANANRGATRAKTTRRHSMAVSNVDVLAAMRDDWERKRQIGGVRCENTVGTARSVARNALGAARSVVRTLSVPRQACYMLCGHLSNVLTSRGRHEAGGSEAQCQQSRSTKSGTPSSRSSDFHETKNTVYP